MRAPAVLLVPSVFLSLSSSISAADGPAGSWRMTVDLGGGRSVTFRPRIREDRQGLDR